MFQFNLSLRVMLVNRCSRLLCLTLPGHTDPEIAIAASRAGAVAVLDLEYAREMDTAQKALSDLTRLGRGQRGVKIDLANENFASGVLESLPTEIETIVIAHPRLADLGDRIQTLLHDGRQVMVEATSAEVATIAANAGAAGVILKGNEAGGWVGEETAFVLLQRCVGRLTVPLWVQGGIGLDTAAACIMAGAAGVVLDWHLALAKESPLPEPIRQRLLTLDGSESTTIRGGQPDELLRVYSRPGESRPEGILARAPESWRNGKDGGSDSQGDPNPVDDLSFLSQDAVFAARLARQYRTVGGIVRAFEEGAYDRIQTARDVRPLDEHGPLATAHGTRYPILQGPMTRVSDLAPFCEAVGSGGALPFVALAMMRAPQVDSLLQETAARMAGRPWGVGILGFVPLELRQEQLEVVHKIRPPFAIIAGGRPEQAAKLEREGVLTYLHVPSPGLLELFLETGALRFIFEGRECGGHVGPRSSFVLWQLMSDLLCDQIDHGKISGPDCHVVLAGGVHDARSAAMASVIAGSLASRGVKIGVLMGTAYLFTEEAVASGAIAPQYQLEALRCDRTVLLETGPGHAIRCFDTPFVGTFAQEKEALLASGRPGGEVRTALEELNLGRLRIASKGIRRNAVSNSEPGAPRYIEASAEEQRADGMYMSGQVAALHDRVTTIAQLHRDVTVAGTELLKSAAPEHSAEDVSTRPSDVAIVGMSTLLPKAPSLEKYWENILGKVDAIEEVPEYRWDPADYFDPDPTKKDRVYSKWGGFLQDVPFDPAMYGIPPNSLPHIDPLQLLTLEVTRAALADAGYSDRPFDRELTSVILGVGGGVAGLGQRYGFRSMLPNFFGEQSERIIEELGDGLPDWTEDSFPGILMNVAAGRVANRFDLGGSNFTIDAACASSLAAVYLGLRELESGTSNMVLVGGVDTMQSPFEFVAFSKTHALSPRGRCRTFDDSADGIAISEGLAMLVLKRLEDAERDGDRIYAVIKGIGSSSDGRDKGLTAPRPEGQVRAMERAYAKAAVSPATIGLIEAHGTGTVAGDRAEVTALTTFFADAQAEQQSCAIGSVKSMIGHTKCAAGAVGLVKVALALHHKVLPPTLGVDKPNSRANFPETPFYVNSETRPWIGRTDLTPRRAGVSAFGFGGTNFHAVVEEYTGGFLPTEDAPVRNWPCELFMWSATHRRGLLEALTPLEQALAAETPPSLADLAFTICSCLEGELGTADVRLAIVARSVTDLREKLRTACSLLDDPSQRQILDPRGIFFSEEPLGGEGRVAFLFAGQGSQYPNMGCDLALCFPEARACYELADACLADQYERPLSTRIFPPPSFTDEEAIANRELLKDTHVAQPALGATAVASSRVLGALGVKPDMVAGHSYGEFAALWAAGTFDESSLFRLSEARGRFMRDGSAAEPGTMAAVEADAATVATVLEGLDGVTCANINAPKQTVISGGQQAIDQATARLSSRGIAARPLPVACAFHSPLVVGAREQLAEVLAATAFRSPAIPVYSNTTAGIYPDDPGQMVGLLADHLVKPVEFVQQIDAMYRDGARIFVEVGPKAILSGLTDQILAERPHLAVPTDREGRPGLQQLQLTLARLWAEGVSVAPERLFAGRGLQRLDLSKVGQVGVAYGPTTWLVNGWRAIPASRRDEPFFRRKVKRDKAPEGNGALAGSDASPRYSRATILMEEPVTPNAPQLAHTGSTSVPIAGTPVGATVDSSSGNGHAVVPGARTPSSPALTRSEAATVVAQFQQVMSHFLETQRSVMLAYLGGPAAAVPQGQTEQAPTPIHLPPAATVVSTELALDLTEIVPPVPSISVREEWQANGVSELIALPGDVVVSEPPPSPALTRESVTAQLQSIVAERTGYPPEMLAIDLDLEADLGIDSIKRVEILGALRKQVGGLVSGVQDESAMEQLAAQKTLQGIVDWVFEQLAEDTVPAAGVADVPISESPNGATTNQPASEAAIRRSTLKVTEAPLAGARTGLASGGVVLITDDGSGMATVLAQRLRQSGAEVALVQSASITGQIVPGTYMCRLDSEEAVQELAGSIHDHQGKVTAVVHLLPTRGAPAIEELSFSQWRQRAAEDLESLFGLARAFASDLRAAAQAGGAALLAVTAMDGTFGTDEPAGSFPGAGAIVGLTKTIALEWPDVRVRAIDLGRGASVESLVDGLLRELYTEDREVEVGYRAGRRHTIRLEPAPLSGAKAEAEPELKIDSSSVILLTGGARGITGQVAVELARRYRPTLLLAGRTLQPLADEDPATRSLSTAQDLKSAIMARMRHEGHTPTPAEVEQEYRSLIADREIRATLRDIEATGARACYFHVDVRDEAAMERLLGTIYERFGRLDGVVHGAGVIEDKLIEQKDPESFRRVFGTKADSGFLLARLLRFDQLRFLAFFSSVSGRFGNRGQGDYAAGNEVLNKLARQLDRRYPTRVVAINWGPWATAGMVSPELQRQFGERGVSLVSPEVGVRMFDEELRLGRKGDAEIVIAGGRWSVAGVDE
jgi:acyl transferase domain-containing protein/NAD(P)H-dependent flavin oxidoreductase YrpB (nitropropane dioxygenase family)/NAD(P)-dependent dehydrogenase (short-subunit alcohol dehydrogenase family)/acyl carrier protein